MQNISEQRGHWIVSEEDVDGTDIYELVWIGEQNQPIDQQS